MASKGRSKNAENASAVYKSSKRWEANRKRKLERVLKEQPNNQQVKDALKSMVYRRKTPKTSEWSHSWKKMAQLFKQFTGKFDRDIMNSNPVLAQVALRTSRKECPEVKFTLVDKSFFSIKSRLYTGSMA